MDRWVRVHKETMVGFDEAAVSLCFRNPVAKTGPLFGEESPDTARYPVDLLRRGGADAEKHHFGHVSRMLFGISERQGRSPGPSKHQPPLNTEIPSQQLDICKQMGRRVGGEVNAWVARVRRTSSASALIELHDPIDVGVKVPPPACRAAGTRSAMEDERGLASGIAARLPIDLVPVTDIEHAMIVWFYIWVQFAHRRG